MSLSGYANEFEAIAQELAELASPAERRQMARLLEEHGLDAIFDHHPFPRREAALALIARPADAAHALLQRLAPAKRQPVLLFALYLACQTASDMRRAEFYQQLVGMPPREALPHAAEFDLQGEGLDPLENLVELLSSYE